jgi:MurNAc alpha-1-phosphate uridylyltransferase
MNNTMFPVVILAGGLATRLRPLTETIPKALLDINGVPFISHQLSLLRQHGIQRVVMCIGYLGEMVQDYLGDGSRFGMHIQYSFDGDVLLGTGGAIKKALPLLDEHFFVLYGDSYLPCHYESVQTAFIQQHCQGLMTVYKNHGKWDTSNVEFVENKIITYDKINRTERMHYIDYGLGVFSRKAFEQISDNEVYDLAKLYQQLLNKNQLAAFEITERFYEVGSFAGIEELEYYLAQT